jgi:hypothetical protein
VSYSSLPALGWDLPPRRGRVDNTETAIKSFDFWSVLCSGHAKHTSDWKSCKQADRPSGVGATHIRYDCTDKTFWLLMYVWDGIYMSRNAGDLWAVNSCGPACTSSDAAFLRFQKDGTGGSCGTTCSNAANSSCCRDVWPVTDGTAGWVGWLAKGTFSLINSSAVFHDRVMVSMCWGDTCGNTTLTASTPNGYSSSASPGVCFSCAGELCRGLGCRASQSRTLFEPKVCWQPLAATQSKGLSQWPTLSRSIFQPPFKGSYTPYADTWQGSLTASLAIGCCSHWLPGSPRTSQFPTNTSLGVCSAP